MRYCFPILLGIVVFALSGCSHSSLEDAIESKWKDPIHIKITDTRKDTVVFNDGNQYVFNTYSYQNGKYTYTSDGEDGWRTGSTILIRATVRPGIGDVVWGVVTSKQPVSKVDVVFTRKTDPTIKIPVTISLQDNAFIGYPTIQIFSTELDAYNLWDIHAEAYDENGQILSTYP